LNKDKISSYRRKYVEKYPFKKWVSGTINSHRKREYIIEVIQEELEAYASIVTNCELCGCELNWNKRRKGKYGPRMNSPTLDRINNEDTISMSNIMIVCLRCNMTKSDRSLKDFVLYCKKIIELHGDMQ
jgi:hypothetical protein